MEENAPMAAAPASQETAVNATADQPAVDPYSYMLGIYQGRQEPYYMKNKYGDEMIINGNKIPVPGADYKFLLQEGNKVSLQQTNLENGQRYYYEGSFTVMEDGEQFIKIQCDITDGSGSSPTYEIALDKQSLSGNCRGGKYEPEFTISRAGDNARSGDEAANNSNIAGVEPSQQEQQAAPDGIYSYRDASVSLQIVINGNSWQGKTVIITGMGDEYDEVSYESGVVKGNTLFESSGYVEIGNVNGKYLTTSIGNNRVTLTKN